MPCFLDSLVRLGLAWVMVRARLLGEVEVFPLVFVRSKSVLFYSRHRTSYFCSLQFVDVPSTHLERCLPLPLYA